MCMDNIKTYLFVIPTGGGGAEKVSINIAKILYRHGYNIKVLFIKSSTDNVCKYLPYDIPSEIICASNKISRYLKIAVKTITTKPSIAFSSLTALSMILVICKLFRPKLKVITRQCFTPGTESAIVEKTIAMLFNKADYNIAQTDEMRMSMINSYGLNPKKVVTINNPLDIEDIQAKIKGYIKKDNETIQYIAIGRLHPQKDYPTLLKSFKKVTEIRHNVKLKIFGIGEENYVLHIKELIREYNLDKYVEIHKYTSNPYLELLNSDCFVLTSITEGLPNVLIEAMYLNVPCVATISIPFITQHIKNGINGYACKVGDIDSIAEAMIKAPLLKDNIQNDNYNSTVENLILKIF